MPTKKIVRGRALEIETRVDDEANFGVRRGPIARAGEDLADIEEEALNERGLRSRQTYGCVNKPRLTVPLLSDRARASELALASQSLEQGLSVCSAQLAHHDPLSRAWLPQHAAARHQGSG